LPSRISDVVSYVSGRISHTAVASLRQRNSVPLCAYAPLSTCARMPQWQQATGHRQSTHLLSTVTARDQTCAESCSTSRPARNRPPARRTRVRPPQCQGAHGFEATSVDANSPRTQGAPVVRATADRLCTEERVFAGANGANGPSAPRKQLHWGHDPPLEPHAAIRSRPGSEPPCRTAATTNIIGVRALALARRPGPAHVDRRTLT